MSDVIGAAVIAGGLPTGGLLLATWKVSQLVTRFDARLRHLEQKANGLYPG